MSNLGFYKAQGWSIYDFLRTALEHLIDGDLAAATVDTSIAWQKLAMFNAMTEGNGPTLQGVPNYPELIAKTRNPRRL